MCESVGRPQLHQSTRSNQDRSARWTRPGQGTRRKLDLHLRPKGDRLQGAAISLGPPARGLFRPSRTESTAICIAVFLEAHSVSGIVARLPVSWTLDSLRHPFGTKHKKSERSQRLSPTAMPETAAIDTPRPALTRTLARSSVSLLTTLPNEHPRQRERGCRMCLAPAERLVLEVVRWQTIR